MTTANTRDCFKTFQGQRLVGLLFNALPCHRLDLAAGTKTLIFEDGRGLTIASNGSYWVDSAEDVTRAIKYRAEELAAAKDELADVLTLAGR